MNLTCPNGCVTERFEALNAVVYVTPSGEYHSHDIDQPAFTCSSCGSPAVDVQDVHRTIVQDREAERRHPREYCCPVCESFFQAPREASPVVCPECGETFVPEAKP